MSNISNTRGAKTLSLSDSRMVETLLETVNTDVPPSFIHVCDSAISESNTALRVALSDQTVRRAVSELAKHGYFQYLSRDGESRFVHRQRIPTLWNPVVSGEVEVSSTGVLYSLQEPDSAVYGLLVIFSGMSGDASMASLYRHFAQTYRHIGGLIPGGIAILRIADLGGVNGAFYSDTVEVPDNRRRITELIKEVQARLSVPNSDVVLLGSSKGGSAALLHGYYGNWNFVAVDPILSDKYYEENMNDSHFTGGGVFRESKDSLFGRIGPLMSGGGLEEVSRVFLTSERSAQYQLVAEFGEALGRDVCTVLELHDNRIRSHPEVAKYGLWLTVSLVSRMLAGVGPDYSLEKLHGVSRL